MLAALRDHGLEAERLHELVAAHTRAPETAADVEGKPAFVNVLFVGGNETQAEYEESVRKEVERRRPGAQVQFEFTGWSANWGRQVGRLGDALGQADALVLMRFVRTQLGRSLRRIAGELDKPWVACTGHGRDSMVRAVIRAIDVARELKEHRGEEGA